MNDGGGSAVTPVEAKRCTRLDLPITVLRLGEEQNESDDEAEDAETLRAPRR